MSPRTVVSTFRLPRPTASSISRLAPKKRSCTTVAAKTFSPPAAGCGRTRSGRTSSRTRVPGGCDRAGTARRPIGVSTASAGDDLAVEQVGAADEVRDEGVRRMVVDLLRRGDLHQAPVAQHGDAVGERQRLVLVVGDEQRGDVLPLLDAPDLVAHREAGRRVERRQRLVEQQRTRLEHQRAGERDALLLAAGELARQPVAETGEVDQLQHRLRTPLALAHVDLRTRSG